MELYPFAYVVIGFSFVGIFTLANRIRTLENQVEYLIKQNRDASLKSKPGNCSVMLRFVDKKTRSLLILAITIATDLNSKQAGDIVNSVKPYSEQIIVDKVSEEYANQVEKVIDNHGGEAVVVKK
ncbi:MAG: hypothetical protein WCG25_01480 [bacterium]